jgi:hypothetical protein
MSVAAYHSVSRKRRGIVGAGVTMSVMCATYKVEEALRAHLIPRVLERPRRRCPPGSQGRWLSSEARREPGLDPAKEGAAALRGDQMHWVPWGCRASSACFDGLAIRTCLGRRRLVLLGDSVSAGTFLDICSALGGGKQCAVFNWATGTLPPQAVVAFSPSTGLPPRQGLLNLFGSTDPDGEVLERLLTRANNAIVVFQSGLHDISTLGGSHMRHRIAPLLTYQYHLRKLARVLSAEHSEATKSDRHLCVEADHLPESLRLSLAG